MKSKLILLATGSVLCIFQACHSPETRAVNKNNSLDTAFQSDAAGSGSKDGHIDPNKNNGKTGNNITSETKISDDDYAFLNAAYKGGKMELDLAKIALGSSNSKIKSFATMMIEDHSKMNKEIEALATEKKIVLKPEPTIEEQKHLDEMKALKGSAFDKMYVSMMKTDHAKTISLFEHGVKTQDTKVKDLAATALPTLTVHYEAAKTL